MIKAIKEIIESDWPDNFKETLILEAIAKNKKAIPTILKLLHSERVTKDNLILDMNLELSRTHLFAAMKAGKPKAKESFSITFINAEIKKFYDKYSDYAQHLFYGTESGDKLLNN